VEDLQKAIGRQLLPTITQYLNRAADWLNNSRNQRQVMETLKEVVNGAKTAIAALREAMAGLNKITGSTKASLELLFGALLVYSTAKTAETLWGIAAVVLGIGNAAAGSAARVGLLQASLLRVAAAYAIVNQAVKHLGHPGMGLDFSDPTAGDVTVMVGGR